MLFETLMLPVNVLNTETGMATAEEGSFCPQSVKLTGRGRLKGGIREMIEVHYLFISLNSRAWCS